jgi:hypothetical protein
MRERRLGADQRGGGARMTDLEALDELLRAEDGDRPCSPKSPAG